MNFCILVFILFKSLRFQSAFSKVSVFTVEECERKAKMDTVYRFSYTYGVV